MPRSDFGAGLARLNRKLTDTIPTKARAAANLAVIQGAHEIAELQYALAPIEDGDLRNSIEVTPPGGRTERGFVANDGQAVITAGGERTTHVVDGGKYEFDHALGQEFGTKNMPAQPFFFPAWRALRKRAKAKIARAIAKAVKDGAK